MPLTPAADADLAAIADLINSAYRGDSARTGWTHEADYIDGVRTDAATLRHDIPGPELMLASLDHAMWFHRPFRADQWLLFSVESSSSSDGRGLASGEYYTENGDLVATVMQEALIRRSKVARIPSSDPSPTAASISAWVSPTMIPTSVMPASRMASRP